MRTSLFCRFPTVVLAGATIALTVTAFGARVWLSSHDNAVALSATLAAQKHVLDRAAASEHNRAAILRKNLAIIETAKRNVQTPAQSVAMIPRLLPILPQTVSLRLSQSVRPEPGSLATMTIPAPDLKPLHDYLQDCRACQLKLDAAEGDLLDERAKVQALITERDAAIHIVKRGGFWHRLKQNAKWFAIGGAVGALALSAAEPHY